MSNGICHGYAFSASRAALWPLRQKFSLTLPKSRLGLFQRFISGWPLPFSRLVIFSWEIIKFFLVSILNRSSSPLIWLSWLFVNYETALWSTSPSDFISVSCCFSSADFRCSVFLVMLHWPLGCKSGAFFCHDLLIIETSWRKLQFPIIKNCFWLETERKWNLEFNIIFSFQVCYRSIFSSFRISNEVILRFIVYGDHNWTSNILNVFLTNKHKEVQEKNAPDNNERAKQERERLLRKR